MLKRVFVHRLETCIKSPGTVKSPLGNHHRWRSKKNLPRERPKKTRWKFSGGENSNTPKNFESKIATSSWKTNHKKKIMGPQNHPTFFRLQTPSIGGFQIRWSNWDHFPKPTLMEKPPANLRISRDLKKLLGDPGEPVFFQSQSPVFVGGYQLILRVYHSWNGWLNHQLNKCYRVPTSVCMESSQFSRVTFSTHELVGGFNPFEKY